jgi:glycosyltransferase involved in cell wall biosynthesis
MSAGHPRVAVIVPVWNDEAHLAQALESVQAQSYSDWELIIIDDASTDNSPQIATSFALRDPDRITVLRVEQNVGSAEARNQGIAASRGAELLALLDSDDYFHPDYLKRSLELYEKALAAGRRVGILACNAWLHLPGGVTRETWANVRRWTDSIDLDLLLDHNYVFARALFSRAAFDKAGGFSSDCVVRDHSKQRYAASDDYDLWLRIVEQGYEVAVTREPLAFYRFDPAGRSRDPQLIAEAAMIVYQRALARGALTGSQRRRARKRLRHWRAVHERARVSQALTERRRIDAGALALRAAPHGLVAFLQAPGRWGEWGLQMLRYATAHRPERNAP